MSEEPRQDRRGDFDAEADRIEAAGIADAEKSDREKPAREQAAERVELWNKTEVRSAPKAFSRTGIQQPICPVCNKKLTANFYDVLIPPGGMPPKIGDPVVSDNGFNFVFIGATKFSRTWGNIWIVPGTISARCPSGTFGRPDHRPFCTARCAIVFAQAAYRAGHRLKGSP